MTLFSMTGFGAARAERTLADGAALSISVEIRTVNHKHLQAKVRLPQGYAALEGGVDKAVRARLSRGAVQVGVEVTRTGGQPSFSVDLSAVERYQALQESLGERFQGLRPIDSVTEMLGLPGVLVHDRSRQSVDLAGEEAHAVLAVVEEALEALLQMRAVEGEAMGADVAGSGEEIAALVVRISERMAGAAVRHRARLVERVGELAGDKGLEEADLAREIALLADRLDISEEIARLDSHLAQLRAVLSSGGSVGRQLDFLAQEFFREANTVGSKCNDAEVAHLVVELKTHVERLREQVQNIE
jgi:uncharacterized protein (TIGR00255 family)